MGKARTAKTPNMRLREQREQRQLTQAALAEKLGVSTLTVGRWERGEAVPTPYALKKLCTLLEATPQALGFPPEEEKITRIQDNEAQAPIRSAFRLSRRGLVIGAAVGSLAVVSSGAVLIASRARASSPTPVLSSHRPQPKMLKPSLIYTGHLKRVESVAWHPTDIYLASASADGIVRVWHAQNGDDLFFSQCAPGIIYWLAWSPNGQWLALAGDNRAVWVIPASPSQRLTPNTCPSPYREHQGPVYACAWSPDSSWIASGGQDETLRVWSVATKDLRFTPIQITSPISTVDWSPDGTFVLFGAKDGHIYRCEASTGQHLTIYRGHTLPVNAVAWAPTARQFASASDDGTMRVWDTATGRVEHIYRANQAAVDAVAWSADGRYLASGGEDKLAHIWDARTFEDLYACAGNLNIVNALAWSHHGYRLASAGQDKSVQIWDLSTASP